MQKIQIRFERQHIFIACNIYILENISKNRFVNYISRSFTGTYTIIHPFVLLAFNYDISFHRKRHAHIIVRYLLCRCILPPYTVKQKWNSLTQSLHILSFTSEKKVVHLCARDECIETNRSGLISLK